MMDQLSERVYRPGKNGGLRSLTHYRYLLKLLINKEIQVRYRGSWLGMVWTYVKPATQFIVFYVAMGVFLGLNRGGGIEQYAIYLFCGVVLTNLFVEAFGNCTRSIVGNSGLIQKIYLPRELFPLASLRVALFHFFPQIVVLVVGSILLGWKPDVKGLIIGLAGLVIIILFALGLGLFFGSINVFYRDAENFTDIIAMVAMWLAPCFYTWQMVANAAPAWLLKLYLMNPICAAVEAFHRAFWFGATSQTFQFAESWVIQLSEGLAISIIVLIIGEMTFRRLEGRFAQEI